MNLISAEECIAVIPGCKKCVVQLRKHEVCDYLCRSIAEFKARDVRFHDLMHKPLRCGDCKKVLDDYEGNDDLKIQLCKYKTCRIWQCPYCGWEYASDGPVGCRSCSPVREEKRDPRLSNMHRAYRHRRR